MKCEKVTISFNNNRSLSQSSYKYNNDFWKTADVFYDHQLLPQKLCNALEKTSQVPLLSFMKVGHSRNKTLGPACVCADDTEEESEGPFKVNMVRVASKKATITNCTEKNKMQLKRAGEEKLAELVITESPPKDTRKELWQKIAEGGVESEAKISRNFGRSKTLGHRLTRTVILKGNNQRYREEIDKCKGLMEKLKRLREKCEQKEMQVLEYNKKLADVHRANQRHSKWEQKTLQKKDKELEECKLVLYKLSKDTAGNFYEINKGRRE
eukprot:TRINITY_DN105912_c0_g1_i1.p1 TRINITY_DN105912_c0_g1~~TRINITY_DN105912_c0_g1_i1.p1  ORF type:complete len:299 (-),score=25.95 TRINITY_DN105912_c0_g1_i1:278-1081(-)